MAKSGIRKGTLKEKGMLFLKTVRSDMTAHGGFKWPPVGEVVEAPDWDPEPQCGGGLHGLPWGEGDGTLLDWSEGAVWVVFESVAVDGTASDEEAVLIDNGLKAKCRRARVLYAGTKAGAIKYLLDHGAIGHAVVGASVAAGDGCSMAVGAYGQVAVGAEGTATAGRYGQAVAGEGGRVQVGDHGVAVVGDRGTAKGDYNIVVAAGYRATAEGGGCSVVVAGDRGRAVAGYFGIVAAGHGGTAIAGDGGMAVAGDEGTAIAGDNGMAVVGRDGRASAGLHGRLVIKSRYGGVVTAVVGEGGIRPNTLYCVGESGELEEDL